MADLTKNFVAQVHDAIATQKTLKIEGGGSKHWYGNLAEAQQILATTEHTGIVDYDPAELVLTVRSGTLQTEIEAVLRAQWQMLAFEPPRFSPMSTMGGAIATALSGPGRPFVGGARDFILGVHVVDGRGDVLRFGGQVMKNVAGYDVSRLMTGALGSLGLITQVSLKVLPIPYATATLMFELGEAEAIHRVNDWLSKPLPLTASLWENGLLHVRLSGAQAAVSSAQQQLGGVRLDTQTAEVLWDSLRDQKHIFFKNTPTVSSGRILWRLSLPATASVISHTQLAGADHQLIEWGGAQRWLWSDTAPDTVRTVAHRLGGHAVRFNNQHGGGESFAPLPPALLTIHRRLKQSFDPHGIFNPGRLYQGL